MRLSDIGLPAFKLLSSRLYDDNYKSVSYTDLKRSKAFYESIIGALPKEPCTIVFMGSNKDGSKDVLFKVDCTDNPRIELKEIRKTVKLQLDCFELLRLYLEFMEYREVEVVLGKSD